MSLEKIWYEIAPYVYILTAVVVIRTSAGSVMLEASGFLLFFVAITIVALRYIHRHSPVHDGMKQYEKKRDKHLSVRGLFTQIEDSIDG